MIKDIDKPGVVSTIPPIDSSLAGAPPTVPGSGSGVSTAPPMTGTPVQQATVPPPIDSSLAGAPNAGNTVQNVTTPEGEQPQQGNVVKTSTDREHVTEVSEQQQAPEGDKPKMSYVAMFQEMFPYKPPTKEDLEKERKRQKREAIFTAIGEGISAMSNLWFTSQYAPNMYDGEKSLGSKTRERWDKLMKEREANQKEYMTGLMRAMEMDANQEYRDRTWTHTLEREKVQDQFRESADLRAEARANRDAAMADLRMRLMQGKIDTQEAIAEAKRIEAEYVAAYQQSRINKNNRTGTGSGGGATPKIPVFNKDGDVVGHVHTRDEAVSETERNGGTYPIQTRETQTDTQNGRRKKSTSTTTLSAGRTPRQQNSGKKPNPMGSSSSQSTGKQKKKNPMS